MDYLKKLAKLVNLFISGLSMPSIKLVFTSHKTPAAFRKMLFIYYLTTDLLRNYVEKQLYSSEFTLGSTKNINFQK